MKNTIIKIGCFLVILSMALICWNEVFKMKKGDGIYSVKTFYELEDNTVDVLILGSSHAFENFNTGILWDDYGMSAYILAGSVQPMWNTYYYLKEALKTQKPKLIVLEGYGSVISQEYMDDSRIIKNNYGLDWSIDKVKSLWISTPPKRRNEFFLEYIQYHSRYKELSRGDFLDQQGNPLFYDWKGFGCNMVTQPLNCMDVSNVTVREDLTKKTEDYYREIINLAKTNNIPIIVIVSPYAGITTEQQAKFNRASDIAAEMDVPFINCNLLINEIGMDYFVDAADTSHLNYRGNQKFSRFIGKYLLDRYDIPDHRGEERYKSWDRQADFIRQMIYDQELLETTDVNIICEKIKNRQYWTFISVDGICRTSDPHIREQLNAMGICEEDVSGIWFFDGGKIVWYSGMLKNEMYRMTSHHDFHLSRNDNSAGEYNNSIIMDNTSYRKVTNGVNVVVYDTMTEKIVETFGLDADNGYNLVR